MNSQRAGGVVCFVVAALFAGMALDIAVTNLNVPDDAPVAEATIVSVHESRGRFDGDSYVTVEFDTADGRRVRADVADFDWTPEPDVGDSARIRYSPTEPSRYVRDARHRRDWFGPVVLGTFAAAFACAGVLGVRRRLPRWALER